MKNNRMNRWAIFGTGLLLLLSSAAMAGGDRTVRARRTDHPVVLDGKLMEGVWQEKGCTGFLQNEPRDGQPATEKTEVWVAYDDRALYVAARMDDVSPEKLISQLARRDDFVDSEWFVFYLDPYFDRRSGYQFAVNPEGSICDWTISNDVYEDASWNGIWDYGVHRDDSGWSVEMRIPFEQLRFVQRPGEYLWGVNFRRYIKHKNEMVSWSWHPREETGKVSHFGRLTGIRDISPRRLVELKPYTTGKAAYGTREEGNPYQAGSEYLAGAGLDMKVGLQSNLTLDATINPDFGQVEVDPAVINLSAAESYYQEKRPFFIEGSGIFQFGQGGTSMHIGADFSTPSFFYSRRIGRPPMGGVSTSGYADIPEWTTILGAAKVTGKVGKNQGWSIGLLTSLTQGESARVWEDGVEGEEKVEPPASYNVLRAQKEWDEGRRGLGFIATGVFRNLSAPGMEEGWNRNAVSFAVDGWTALDKKKTWMVTGWLGTTSVTGSADRIFSLQQSYPHYFQRPDAGHLDPDPAATVMRGLAGRFQLVKQQGNFLFHAALGVISPGFESNDLGYQSLADLINAHVMAGYQDFTPGKIFRFWQLLLFTQRNYDFGGNLVGEQRAILIANATLRNYWSLYFQMSHNPERWDKYLTRGGPLAVSPTFNWFDFGFESDGRKPLVWGIGAHHRHGAAGSRAQMIRLNLRWKPGSNFHVSLQPGYEYNHRPAQWVTGVEDPWMTETGGTRYVFGDLVQKTLSMSLRVDWIFTPRLSLQAYIQPFISVGDYGGFKELARPKSFDFSIYGDGMSDIGQEGGTYTVDPDGPGPADAFAFGNPDFNYKSLRGTVVLRWEYRPGSTLYLVWTQNRADYTDPGDLSLGRDLGSLFRAPGDNIFMVKLTYRLPL